LFQNAACNNTRGAQEALSRGLTMSLLIRQDQAHNIIRKPTVFAREAQVEVAQRLKHQGLASINCVVEPDIGPIAKRPLAEVHFAQHSSDRVLQCAESGLIVFQEGHDGWDGSVIRATRQR
jgi:hypothetical protein